MLRVTIGKDVQPTTFGRIVGVVVQLVIGSIAAIWFVGLGHYSKSALAAATLGVLLAAAGIIWLAKKIIAKRQSTTGGNNNG